MDQNRFDTVTRVLRGAPSRRRLLRGLAAAGLGWGVARLPDGAAAKKRRTRKQKSKESLCTKNGAPCTKPGKNCKRQYCLNAPFTIEAAWTGTADHDTYLFVPPENATTGPAPYIYACVYQTACQEKYPFACVNDDIITPTYELATINRLLPGTYEYWIELDKGTAAGELTIVLKDNTGRVVRRWANAASPTEEYVGWHVFDIDGRDGRVTAIDQQLIVGAGTTALPYGAHDPHTLVCPLGN